MADEIRVYKVACESCGAKITFKETLLGKTKPCPKCGAPLLLAPAEDASGAAPKQPASAPASGAGDSAPETNRPSRMKANKAIAGSVCPCCEEEIDLGDEIFNCPDCQKPMHFDCYTSRGGCGNAECPSCAAASGDGGEGGSPEASGAVAPLPGKLPAGAATKECPHCGETILKSAKKCKFCKEMLDKSLKDRKDALVNDADNTLATWEILLSILCGGIACIVGIVFVCMGKKKGWKMILIALVSSIVWNIISALIRHH